MDYEKVGSTSIFYRFIFIMAKGAIENINKIVRQYISKDMNIASVTDVFIMKIQKKINARPREKLNFSTTKIEFLNFVRNIALAC